MSDESEHLIEVVAAVLPGWVERSVRRLLEAWSGAVDPAVMAEAHAMGERAAAEVTDELRRLLAADVDAQWTTPLTILRQAVRYPTAVLRDAGVPEVVRDQFDERHFPDDPYGLTPMSFADVDPSLQEPAIRWGAAKAMAHKARHQP